MTVLTAKQLERQRTQRTATTAPGATSTEPETINIRARQSEIEREAETAKATIREVGRKERRGRELPLKAQRTKGIAGAVVEVESARKEAHAEGKVVTKAIGKLVAEHEKQLEGIAKYKSGEGYDLAMMIQDGYTPKQLTELGFASDVITKAQDRVAELAKADKYKGTDGYNLVAMVNDGYTQSQLESLFGKDAAGNAITRADIITRAASYKTDTGYDVAAMVRANFPQADMAILFESDTISKATELVQADKYKTETGYDLLTMFDDGYTQTKVIDMGFDTNAVNEAWEYHQALDAMEPYKNTAGTYDIERIAEAVDAGTLTEATVTKVLGENPVPYLTIEQVAAIRFYPTAEAYKLGHEWGITDTQIERIRTASTEDRARLFAYLWETAGGITRDTVIPLPEFQTQAEWKILASALKDIEPYQIEGGQYDVAKAYQAMTDGKLSKASFILAFGQDTYSDTKAFYNANVEIKPGEWVAKSEWQGLTPAQQKEVIATGKLTTLDTTGLVKLDTGEYITTDDWGKLDTTAQGYLKKHGIDKFNKDYTAPSQGWLKDTWAGIKAAMVVTDKTKENATAYCKSMGITNGKIVAGAAQWIQLSRMFIPRPTADPKTDPKGYLIETGKAIAAYAPIAWVVNWKTMSVTDRIINGAIDVVTFATLGLGSGLRALRARPVLKAATAAGSAANKMGDALQILAKTPMDDVARYTKASSTASNAIQASKVADAKFVTALERVKALTPGQLTKLEKTSQIKGFKRAILDVSNAQTQLKKTWKGVPKSTLQTMGGKSYITKMARVERAQKALNKALETFNTKLEPRFKVNPTPEFKGFATEWHKKILPTLEGGDEALKPPGNLGGYGKGGTMSKEFYEQEYKKMVEGWQKPKPQPYEVSPSAGPSTSRSRVATLEKTGLAGETTLEAERSPAPKLEFETVHEMKIKPVYRTEAKVAQGAVTVPVVKAGKVAQTVMATSTVGRAIETQTAIATAKVMKAVTGKTQPMTATEWNTQRAIETITKDAVLTGIDASTRNVTSSQLQDLIATDVAQSVRNITDTKLRTEVQTQVKAITKIAIKLATKVATKYGKEAKTIKGKPGLRVNLPESETDKEGRPIYPPGTAVFQMGKTKRGPEYKAILPPYDQTRLVSSKLPPVGMKRTRGTPQETLTFIGGKIPSKDISADMGVTDIFIDTKARKIRFTGGGLRTDVGKRISGPTKGVSFANNANNMRVTRQGPIFYTQLKGQRGFTMSRHNPRRRHR
jgi:hypothetical protein